MIYSRDRLVTLLTERLDVTRGEAQALLATLLPALQLNDLAFEDQWPAVRHGVCGGPVAGAAGTFAQIQLRNPAASGVFAVITQLTAVVFSTIQKSGVSSVFTADNVGTLTRMHKDRRAGDAALVCTVTGANNLAATNMLTVAETYENPLGIETKIFPVGVFLPEGVAYGFEAGAVFTSIRAHFHWYEWAKAVR